MKRSFYEIDLYDHWETVIKSNNVQGTQYKTLLESTPAPYFNSLLCLSSSLGNTRATTQILIHCLCYIARNSHNVDEFNTCKNVLEVIHNVLYEQYNNQFISQNCKMDAIRVCQDLFEPHVHFNTMSSVKLLGTHEDYVRKFGPRNCLLSLVLRKNALQRLKLVTARAFIHILVKRFLLYMYSPESKYFQRVLRHKWLSK